MIGIGGQAAIKLFGLNVDAAAQRLCAKVDEQGHALHAVLLEQLFGQIDGAIRNDLHDELLERYAHCTSFCYNNDMQPITELGSSEAGLIYRLRRGQPHAPLMIMLHGLSGDENVMWIFDHALPRAATVIAPRALYASEFGGARRSRSS
jgi:hypothetical protein